MLAAQRRATRLVTIFPRDHGRRLAPLLPQGRFELITRGRTFIPEDQPDLLATAIEEFLAAHPTGTEYARGEEPFMLVFDLLDLTPYGRGETWKVAAGLAATAPLRLDAAARLLSKCAGGYFAGWTAW